MEKKLPKAFKKKWIAALKSGKYKRGKGQLKEVYYNSKCEVAGFKYCCLGVAGDILKLKMNKQYFLERIIGVDKVPAAIRGNKKTPGTLAKMNDSGKSFKKIADWIEKNL